MADGPQPKDAEDQTMQEVLDGLGVQSVQRLQYPDGRPLTIINIDGGDDVGARIKDLLSGKANLIGEILDGQPPEKQP